MITLVTCFNATSIQHQYNVYITSIHDVCQSETQSHMHNSVTTLSAARSCNNTQHLNFDTRHKLRTYGVNTLLQVFTYHTCESVRVDDLFVKIMYI